GDRLGIVRDPLPVARPLRAEARQLLRRRRRGDCVERREHGGYVIRPRWRPARAAEILDDENVAARTDELGQERAADVLVHEQLALEVAQRPLVARDLDEDAAAAGDLDAPT